MQRTVIKIADAQIARCATGRQLYVLLQTAGVRMKKRDVWPESVAEYSAHVMEDVEQPCTVMKDITKGVLVLSQPRPVLLLPSPSVSPPSTSV
jgi:hypothetical protein